MIRPARLDGVPEIMIRVGAVLDEDRGNSCASLEKDVFEYVAGHMADAGMERKCPIVSLIDHVGNYWRNWLILLMRAGPHRPSVIMRLLAAFDPSRPISQRMLTLDLRCLERDGIIQRSVIGNGRAHVEYSLTPLGKELSDRIMSLIEWADSRQGQVLHARGVFDAADR